MNYPIDSKLLFLGDLYLTDLVDAKAAVDQFPFIFNLEAPISTRGKPAPGKINLRIEADYILACFGRRPFAVCLANNHIMDYGVEAFEDTLDLFSGMSIPFFGAGRAQDNFNNPAIIGVGVQKVALMGYVCSSTHPIYASRTRPGVCPIDVDHIRDDIQKAKAEGATRIVTSLHWGAEEVFLPKPEDVRVAHSLIDHGADVIVGHHAHVPQLIEDYHGKPIAYGLGNFAVSDLCVPAYADENGNFTEFYRKQQKAYNRVSLGVLWDISHKSWETKEFEYDVEMVRQRPLLWFYDRNVNVNAKYYPLRYEMHLRKRRLMHVVENFAARPKLPRPRHFASLIRTLMKP